GESIDNDARGGLRLNSKKSRAQWRASMKLALSLGWILMIALAVQGHSAPTALERVSISGVEYVRLEDWARANRLQFKSTKQEVQVFNNDFNATFVADSQRAALN